MSGGSEDKNLPPSAKKLRDARKKGQVAKSKDLVSAAVTLAGVGFIVMHWDALAANCTTLIEHAGELSNQPLSQALPLLALQVAATALSTILPLMLCLLLAAMLSSVIATGGVVLSLDPLMPKLQKLNPAQGVKKLISVRGLLEVVKSLFKLALIGINAFWIIRGSLQSLVELPACGLGCTGVLLHASLLPLAGSGVIVFLIFGLADMGIQRWLFIRDQRMSHTEKKNEHKNSEGNPLIRGAHKRERREASHMRAGLGQATFLVTGTRIVVAMRYSSVDTRVPMSVGRTEADDVVRFVQEGRRLKLPILHEPDLARALFDKVQIGQTIPRELFQPVILGMKRLSVIG